MRNKLLLLAGGLTAALSAQAQWATQTVPYNGTGLTTNYLDAVDGQVCWAAAVDQQLFTTQHQFARTTNGGQTWTAGTVSNLGENEYISGIAGLNATTAVIATRTDGVNGRLLRTTNGGATWAVCSAPGQLSISRSYPLFLHFFDAQHGLCVGDAINDPTTNTYTFELYRTADAGLTWTRVPQANLPTLQASEEVRGYPNNFGNSYWFTTNKGRVFRSADQGLTWNASSPNLGNFIQSIAFRDANNGVAVAVGTSPSNHRLVATTNGGATWQNVAYSGPLHGWSLEYVPGTNILLAVGINNGTGDQGSSISRDNGLTWQGLETTQEHITLDAAAPDGVWTGAFNSATGEGVGVYKLNATVLANNVSSSLQRNLRVWPNPAADGRFAVELGVAPGTAVAVQVTDALGRPVFSYAGAATTLPIDLGHQAAGVYVLRLTTAAGTASQRLLVR